MVQQNDDESGGLAAAGTGVGSGLGMEHAQALKNIILQLQDDMKTMDKQRRATHLDELERFQMEETIRESAAELPPEARVADRAEVPQSRGLGQAESTSPRTAKLLREVEEISLILVAVYTAWE
eukprot:65594-Alexandrium_andersonii.AAC.1